MAVLKSSWLLLSGIIKRFYWYVLPLFLDPFDFAERYFGVEDYVIPQWLAWSLFGLGLAVAATLTYHELRTQVEQALSERLEGLREVWHKRIKDWKVTNDSEFVEWKRVYQLWRDRASDCTKNLRSVRYETFKPFKTVGYNDEHVSLLDEGDKIRQEIKAMIDQLKVEL